MDKFEELLNEERVLHEKLKPAWEQRNKVSTARAERDKLNAKIKELRNKARVLKAGRDKLNSQVKEEKKQRDKLNKQGTELKKKLTKEEREFKPNELSGIKERIRKLQWQIETSGVEFSKERTLRNKMEELEKTGKELQKLADSRNRVQEISSSAKTYHTKVLELSERSEKTHKDLLGIYEEIKSIRAKADEKHRGLLSEKTALKTLEDKNAPELKRIREIRKKIPEVKSKTMERTVREVSKKAEERVKEAHERLKAGKKVDLRELQMQYLKEGKTRKNSSG